MSLAAEPKTIDVNVDDLLAEGIPGTRGCLLFSLSFDPALRHRVGQERPSLKSWAAQASSIARAGASLRDGGLLFVYGPPEGLALVGSDLLVGGAMDGPFQFRYWIALDIDDLPPNGHLPSGHLGLLMLQKTPSRNGPELGFPIDPQAVRRPFAQCRACGEPVADWGGKKHLANPRGAALSDVWRDLPRRRVADSVLPPEVLDRVRLLTAPAGEPFHVILHQRAESSEPPSRPTPVNPPGNGDIDSAVLNMDCIEFMRELTVDHPQGAFDLIFADPPYNLGKLYASYSDGAAEDAYVHWCEEWLDLCTRVLRPGGSLYVLNLPRWGIRHSAFLSRRLDFRQWIVWDSMSSPAGKLMPAHYALLLFTKPGRTPYFHPSHGEHDCISWDGRCPRWVDGEEFCFRQTCVRSRTKDPNFRRQPLNDFWSDVHRIKHKKDRDSHPCQLPVRLLLRSLLLSSQEGDLVFDPFGGAGTTAVAAKMLRRRWVITDIDPKYCEIASQNLARLQPTLDGGFVYQRRSVARPAAAVNRKWVETEYVKACLERAKLLTADEVMAMNRDLAAALAEHPEPKFLQKIARRRLRENHLTVQASS